MRITWVTRTFLDYRIPVYRDLDELCEQNFTLITGTADNPQRVLQKIKQFFGNRAILIEKDYAIGNTREQLNHGANKTLTVPVPKGLLKSIRRSRPDIIICDGFGAWSLYTIMYHLFFRTPVVMCYERTKHTERNCQWIRKVYRMIASLFFTKICANGILCKEYLRDVLHIPEEKLTTGHMVADVENLSSAEISIEKRTELRQKCSSHDIQMLFVGQLIPRKGVLPLLEAFEKYQQNDDCKLFLTLVGNGKLYEQCKKYESEYVQLAGARSYDEISDFYLSADVLIIPTLEDNWSLVVPEAMACGLPVATSIYNGCYPELVHPENGWTFDPLSPDSFQTLFRNIVASRDKLKAMGARSKEIVMNGHTARHAASAIYKTTLSVLSEKAVK